MILQRDIIKDYFVAGFTLHSVRNVNCYSISSPFLVFLLSKANVNVQVCNTDWLCKIRGQDPTYFSFFIIDCQLQGLFLCCSDKI